MLAAGFDMDVAGPLLKGVLEQPVDDIDDVRIVGIRLLVAGPQFQQLLEVAQATGFLFAAGAADRLGQAIELQGQALDVQRAGHHPSHRALENMGQVCFPGTDVRLGAGHGNALPIHGHGKDLVPLGEGEGHQRRDAGHVDAQGVDTQVRLTGLPGQPGREAVQVQMCAELLQVGQLLAGDHFQGMQQVTGCLMPDAHDLFGGILADAALGQQFTQQFAEVQPAVLGKVRGAHGRFLGAVVQMWVSDHEQPRIVPGASRECLPRVAGFCRDQPAACRREGSASSSSTSQTLIRLRSFAPITWPDASSGRRVPPPYTAWRPAAASTPAAAPGTAGRSG